MLSALAVALLAGSTAAYPRTPLLFSRQAYSAPGVATFNDYASQGHTVCGPSSGSDGTYGAAASDISPDISGGACDSTIDMSKCSGNQAVSGYLGPNCPKTNCGKCYKVTNQGAVDGGSIGGIGNSVTVQIIDSCPAESADNYCKTDVPANQRCGDSSTNQLDIDQSAYQALTGTPFGSGPNLQISIEPSDCSGGSSTGNGGDNGVSGAPLAGTVTTPAAGGAQTPPPQQKDAAPSSTVAAGPISQVQSPAPNPTIGGGSTGGNGAQAQLYDQCGGIDNSDNGPWKGPTTCAPPATCQEQNQYYSQCLISSKLKFRREAVALPNSRPLPWHLENSISRREAVSVDDGRVFFMSGDS